jgi:sugar lactone lactonase YvrE
MYISDMENHRIVVVHLNSTTNISIIGSRPGSGSNQFNMPCDVFVTNTSLYVNDLYNRRVQKMSLNGSDPITVLDYGSSYGPYYLFVDNNGNIYLSATSNHIVVLFRSNSTKFTTVAGTGVAGAHNTQLHHPYGLFVNDVGTIYVVDSQNHRIMRWLLGASSGFIVAGNGTAGATSMQLNRPTQIIVDTNEYMYISDADNSRITRWAPNSTFGECIAGCTGTGGTASNQLNAPHSLAFDSNGSLYVSDYGNHRVQKFQILNYQSEHSIP